MSTLKHAVNKRINQRALLIINLTCSQQFLVFLFSAANSVLNKGLRVKMIYNKHNSNIGLVYIHNFI